MSDVILLQGIQVPAALGVTAAQDAWLTPEELAFWGRIHAAGELRLRFRGALIMEPGQTLSEWRERIAAASPEKAAKLIRAEIAGAQS